MSPEPGPRRGDGRGRPQQKRPAGRPAGGRPQQRPRNKAKPEEKNGAAPAGSVAELELAIQEKRDHLAATIDELSARAAPKALAQNAIDDVRGRFDAAIRTSDGQLRTERIAAVGAAVVAVLGLMVWVRRR